VLLSTGSAMVISVWMSYLMNNCEIRVRDISNGTIAGLIVGGTSSFYFTNPAFPIVCGVSAGIFQIILDYGIEEFIYFRLGLVTTYGSSLFILQSFLGAIFSAGFCQRINNGQTD
jgi:hypothetical protein